MNNFYKRVLRVVLVALFAATITLPTALAAKPDVKAKVSISADNMPMRQFLAAIEQQSNYSFFYSNSVLNNAPNVTIEAKDMAIEQILKKVFEGTNRTYEFVGNKIAIKFAPEVAKTEGGGNLATSAAPAAKSAKPQRVSGKVLDENGQPMVGVGVIIVNTLQGVVTDLNGTYEIKEKDGKKTISFDFVDEKNASEEQKYVLGIIDSILKADLPFSEEGDKITIGYLMTFTKK